MGRGGFLQLGEETEASISLVNPELQVPSGKGLLLLGGVQKTQESPDTAHQAWRDLTHSIQLQNQPFHLFLEEER